jgi:MFS family permease
MTLYGVYMALTDGVGKALIADVPRRTRRGTAMGIFYAITGLTSLTASLLCGVIWDHHGATPAFLVGAGFAAAALLLLIALRWSAPASPPQPR